MPATVLDIADGSIPLPGLVVLDASVVLEWIAPPPKRDPNAYPLVQAFMSRVQARVRKQATTVALPLPAFEECVNKQVGWLLQAPARRAGFSGWQQYIKASPSALAPVVPRLRQFRATLAAFPVWIPEPHQLPTSLFVQAPISDRIIDFMDASSVLAKDAHSFALAERLNAGHLAAIDKDWKRADGFTVFAIP